jgi:hypothetical protein
MVRRASRPELGGLPDAPRAVQEAEAAAEKSGATTGAVMGDAPPYLRRRIIKAEVELTPEDHLVIVQGQSQCRTGWQESDVLLSTIQDAALVKLVHLAANSAGITVREFVQAALTQKIIRDQVPQTAVPPRWARRIRRRMTAALAKKNRSDESD